MKTLPPPTSFLNLRRLPPFSNVNNINNLLLCRHSSPLILRLRRGTLITQSMTASTSSDLNQDNSVSTAADVNNDVFQLIQAHQNKASRLTPVQEVKTFLCHSLRGVLSTVSMKHEGYPSGSMVDFACDAYGAPIVAVSDLAVHTKKLMANPKCSLLVSKDPQDRTELVVTMHGDAVPVPEKLREEIRAMYLGQHPNPFWVDFGDFQFLRIEPKVVQYVSGVATALLGSGEFSREEFRTAVVDPMFQFSKPITSHMNKDHTEDTKLMVQHSTSFPVDFAQMLDVDSLGFNVKADCQGNTFKLRIPFPRRAADRKRICGICQLSYLSYLNGHKTSCEVYKDGSVICTEI